MKNNDQPQSTEPVLLTPRGLLREAVAARLFGLMYDGCTDDDPKFPERLWNSLPTDKRRLWYRQADAVVEVIEQRGYAQVTPILTSRDLGGAVS